MVTYQGKNVDFQYQEILRDILTNGCPKDTRAGEVVSLFGKTMRFDLSKGHIPLLTTKKVYTKSVIVELLWFLSGNTNIKYLVENGVHIWVDDAYRYYKELVKESNAVIKILNDGKDFCFKLVECDFISKCDFVKKVLEEEKLDLFDEKGELFVYTYGDMGNIYGFQWRNWQKCDGTSVDQVKNIIDTLKCNPDDRRMILTAWNVGEMDKMGLPPCHFCCEFYSSPIEEEIREEECYDIHTHNCCGTDCCCNDVHKHEKRYSTRRKLSCLLNCRSQDFMLGTPFNIASYAILTRMIAQCVGMEPGELIWVGGDCHVYKNHIHGALEQLSRDPYRFNVPTLQIDDVTDIDSFKFENFHISDYKCYPPIKLPLSVGDDDKDCKCCK